MQLQVRDLAHQLAESAAETRQILTGLEATTPEAQAALDRALASLDRWEASARRAAVDF